MKTTTTTTSTTTAGQPMASMNQPQSMNGQPVTTTGEVAKPSTLARAAYWLHWGTFMLLLAFFSMIVMIASSQVCDETDTGCITTRGYQVALAVVSLAVSLFFGLFEYSEKLTSDVLRTWVSVLLFLWWFAGVIVLTFFGDFQLTNGRAAGYFGTWFAFTTAALSLANISQTFEQSLDNTLTSVRKPVFFLLLSSLVVMGASIGPCSPRDNCVGYAAYAIVVSVVSLAIAIFLFLFPAKLERTAMRYVALFLVVWWIFGAACLTLGDPFRSAGNGFFGCYAALVSAASLLALLNKH